VVILWKVDIVVAVLAASSFLAAAVLLIGRVGALARRRGSRAAGGASKARACPLCSSALEGGERIHSKLYPGKEDRIMHIFGCPRCWPATPSAPRLCPVCGKEIGREGYAVARYFERAIGPGSGGRAHVHVLGCTECRR
jgi:hypothetical protein